MRRLAILLLALPIAANAVPISYDEAIDGDIGIGTDTFDLGIGVNTIVGTISGTNTALGLDFDFFNITLPLEGILENVSIVLNTGAGGNGRFASSFQWSFDDGAETDSISTFAGGVFTPTFPMTSPITFVGFNGLPFEMVNDYVISFSVAAAEVPEPSTLAILGIGLAGIGFARRRRTQ